MNDLPILKSEIQISVLLSAAQHRYGNASRLGWAVLSEPSWGSDRGSPLSVLFAALPAPTQLLIGWLNLEGKLNQKAGSLQNRQLVWCFTYVHRKDRCCPSPPLHIHIWIPLFGYNETEHKGAIFWRSRQMHNFGGQDRSRLTFHTFSVLRSSLQSK